MNTNKAASRAGESNDMSGLLYLIGMGTAAWMGVWWALFGAANAQTGH